MRAAPIGLFFFDDSRRMIQGVHDQGRITHQDRRCSAGAIVIAGAVALALREDLLDPIAFCVTLAEWTRAFDAMLAEALECMPAWIAFPPDKAVRYITRVGLPADYTDEWQGISPFVTGSVLWSVYAFLRTPDDYWQALCTAIAVGGDVDTTAAMTGAISGAHVGLDGIPKHLAQHVHDQGAWGYDDLVALG